MLDPAIVDGGLPDDAFAALTGDDKEVASAAKKQNKAERESWQESLSTGDLFRAEQLATTTGAIEQLADDDLAGVAAKRAAWLTAEQGAHASRFARLADLFVGAFLLPKARGAGGTLPSSRHLWAVANDQEDPTLDAVEQAAQEACAQARVLHWWVAFPQIAAAGGFSVMLGNPPWEQLQLSEEEFFAARDPSIAAQAGSKRKEAIVDLQQAAPRLWDEFSDAKRQMEAGNQFFRCSGRFRLSARGKLDTYPLFSETFLQAIASRGRAGFIVKAGIATDDSNKFYFAHLVDTSRLVSLIGFDNAERIFPSVHSDTPFVLVTLGNAIAPSRLLNYALRIEHLGDPRREFSLTVEEFSLINPNTRTCPVFRSVRDAELTKKLYRVAPVLIREAVAHDDGSIQQPEMNPWGISFSQGLFNMTSDSDLFVNVPAAVDQPLRLPLFEAKMIHQFDHRWATYVDAPGSKGGVDTVDVSDADKVDPSFTVRPRYWVDEHQVLARIARVPANVRKAWLAAHQAAGGQLHEARRALWLALSQWVAGEMFRQDAGSPADGMAFSDSQRMQATPRTERTLAATCPACANALRGAGITSRKALAEFAKWAMQNADVPLTEHELSVLAGFASQTASDAREQVLLDELDAWMDRRSPRWLMGWRDITNATNERTVIASVIPRVGVGNNLPLMLFPEAEDARTYAALLGNLCALALDFVARHKVGGTHLNYFIYKQLPVLPPERYSETDLAYIVPRVLELTYTAQDLAPWAEDLGHTGAPFAWNPDRRAQLRAELDAYYARLYGLSRDELRYILDPSDVMGEDYPSETFRVLKNNEMREFGEYRTRRLVLEAWDALEGRT